MLVFLFAGSAIGTGCQKAETPQQADSAPIEEPPSGPPLTEFTLTESSGSEFQSQQLEGKVWVVSFFFTRCAANCRALNMKVSQLQREFGDRGLQLVSITCDPAHDEPAVLQQYARMYNADAEQWRFLTGEFAYIRRIGGDMFDVTIAERMHDDILYVVDQSGKLRGKYHVRQEEQFDRLRRLLDKLLSQQPMPEDDVPEDDVPDDDVPDDDVSEDDVPEDEVPDDEQDRAADEPMLGIDPAGQTAGSPN